MPSQKVPSGRASGTGEDAGGDQCLRSCCARHDTFWGYGHETGWMQPVQVVNGKGEAKNRRGWWARRGSPADDEVPGDDGREEGRGGPPAESAGYKVNLQKPLLLAAPAVFNSVREPSPRPAPFTARYLTRRGDASAQKVLVDTQEDNETAGRVNVSPGSRKSVGEAASWDG